MDQQNLKQVNKILQIEAQEKKKPEEDRTEKSVTNTIPNDGLTYV